MTVREVLLFAADLMLSIGLLKATMLIVFALLLVRGLRRASAAVRAGVWSFAVLALLSLPLLGYVVPWWDVGLIAFPQSLFDTETALQATLADLLRVAGVRAAPPPAIWLAVLWIAGSVLLGAHFLWQRLGVELIARTGEAARDRRTLEAVARLRWHVGLRRAVRVVHSDLVQAPFAFGVFRATLVLPHAAHEWSNEELYAVLRHELAHVTRADYVLLLIGELARILYWPNPAVWLALGALRRTQDAACDDLVLRGGVPATAYARHLVSVARTAVAGSRLPRAALPLLSHGDLRSRVAAILDRSSDRRPAPRTARALSLAVAAALAVVISGANLWVCPSAEATGDALGGQAAVAPSSGNALTAPDVG